MPAIVVVPSDAILNLFVLIANDPVMAVFRATVKSRPIIVSPVAFATLNTSAPVAPTKKFVPVNLKSGLLIITPPVPVVTIAFTFVASVSNVTVSVTSNVPVTSRLPNTPALACTVSDPALTSPEAVTVETSTCLDV